MSWSITQKQKEFSINSKQTCLEKYGVDNYSKTKKARKNTEKLVYKNME